MFFSSFEVYVILQGCIYRDTVDGCEILHHQKYGWNPNKILACLPPFPTGDSDFFHPPYVSNTWMPGMQVGGASSRSPGQSCQVGALPVGFMVKRRRTLGMDPKLLIFWRPRWLYIYMYYIYIYSIYIYYIRICSWSHIIDQNVHYK